MKKRYFAIGGLVQAVILVERYVTGVSRKAIDEGKRNPWFWVGLVLGCMFNIITWPLAIICEGIDIFSRNRKKEES